MKTAELVVKRIIDEGDRVLIYGDSDNYHVIADFLRAAGLRPGDTVTYEPYGANFGWFISSVR